MAGAAVALLPLLMAAQGLPGPSNDAGNLLAQARQRVAARDFAQADTSLRALLLLQPDSADALYLFGHVLEKEKKAAESLQAFTHAAALRPPSGEDLRVVALDYVLLNDYPDAMHWLTKSLALDPGNSETWYDLGRARMASQDFPGAEKALTKALALSPRLVKAENNLGVVLEGQNHIPEALQAYRLAVEWQARQTPPSEQPLLNYGALLLTQGKSELALPLLQRAVAIAPNDVKCREHLAHALEQQGRRADAISQMTAALQLDPNNPSLHFQLGQIYRRAGDAERSRQEMSRSGQLYGQHSSPDP